MKKAVIVHNRVSAESTIDDLDVLAQVELVCGALQSLGFSVDSLPFTQDDPRIIAQLSELRPDLIFNLVEPVNDGPDKNAYIFAPALYEIMGIPFSGCGSQTGAIVMNKLAMKRLLLRGGYPTPEFISAADTSGFTPQAPYMLKPVSECTSIGLDGSSVQTFASIEDLRQALAEKKQQTGLEFFAEAFVDGREFRVSMVGTGQEPETLPPVEVIFEQFDQQNKLKIYDFTGKWITDSFEFQHTRSSTTFSPQDAPLLQHLQETACACWQIFLMRGYASVDFRVDSAGQPYVVDVNTNPCLTAHPGGITEAAAVIGLNFTDLIARILPPSS